ncbi:AraC family transcriptional regulator [Pacificoceanicola onchidii]|uniref:AraC family transcriptional regulator n=1 Tax=Pacificoceanicola onchidii TaxID=2562685 RepID=UPI001455F589|nr:AraC family transcriptional regulator [Pacificoceanicola onchidii]
MATRYPVGDYLKQMGALLGVDPEKVLRRVGLSPALLSEPEITVGAEQFFRFWDAMCAEADRPDIAMTLAMAYAHGPFIPPIFAFSCAETLALGLARLADFKPLIGPLKMEVTRGEAGLTLSMRPSEPGLSMAPSMGLFELLYITECARTFTGSSVTPIATTLAAPLALDAQSLAYLGRPPKTAGVVSLTIAPEDADRPLITRSPSLWETLEPGFAQQLEERTGTATMAGRIKRVLTEALPGGATSVDDMARRLNVSKRSLQRRLSEEGTSFQELLNETRFEMSDRYLKDSGLSLPEISYLLGFRETSSFFRAFQGWTGTTPGEYRATGSDATPPRLN